MSQINEENYNRYGYRQAAKRYQPKIELLKFELAHSETICNFQREKITRLENKVQALEYRISAMTRSQLKYRDGQVVANHIPSAPNTHSAHSTHVA